MYLRPLMVFFVCFIEYALGQKSGNGRSSGTGGGIYQWAIV